MSSEVPILVLEDDAPIRRAVRRQLERRGYVVHEAGTVVEARAVLHELEDGALVLCDIDLPGESGLVLVQELRVRQPQVAVVMVTAVDDPEVAAVAVDRGAYGYVVKPFEANELVISVLNALRRRELEMLQRRTEAELEALVDLRTQEVRAVSDELRRSYEETIRRLAYAAEYKDPETAHHLERMSRYTEVLALRAGFDAEEAELLRVAAPMHDIGKIGIADDLLLKAGVFDAGDRAAMARHTEIGHRILEGSGSELLQLAAVVALTHHERWDGGGYPSGSAGPEIPIAGRIVAIADVFDALCSRRRYKEPMPPDEAFELLRAEAGGHFDPHLVELFIDAAEELVEIHDAWRDPAPAEARVS